MSDYNSEKLRARLLESIQNDKELYGEGKDILLQL